MYHFRAIETAPVARPPGTNFYEISFIDKFHSRSAFSGSSAYSAYPPVKLLGPFCDLLRLVAVLEVETADALKKRRCGAPERKTQKMPLSTRRSLHAERRAACSAASA
jgi:hypothetical protein